MNIYIYLSHIYAYISYKKNVNKNKRCRVFIQNFKESEDFVFDVNWKRTGGREFTVC